MATPKYYLPKFIDKPFLNISSTSGAMLSIFLQNQKQTTIDIIQHLYLTLSFSLSLSKKKISPRVFRNYENTHVSRNH
jgi:hypothetical protein